MSAEVPPDEPLEPLEPELDRLLDAERHGLPPPTALERVWSRLALPPSGGGGGGSKAGWSGTSVALAVGVAYLAGALSGMAMSGTRRVPEAPGVASRERAEPPPAAPAAPEPSATDLPAGPHPAAPAPRPTPRAARAMDSAAEPSLSAERALLDMARAELSAGNAVRALALLDEHARRFAKPQLGEEREALVIQSLVAVGRYDQARAGAARFKAASPGSLFIPVIEASLGSIGDHASPAQEPNEVP